MHLRLITLLFAFILFSSHIVAEETAPAESAATETVLESEPAKFIEVSNIPEEAIKTLQSMSAMKDELSLTEEELQIKESIPPYIASIDALLDDAFYTMLEYQSIRDMDKRTQEWNVYLTQLRTWEKALKAKIDLLDEKSKQLLEESNLWSETHINATNAHAPQSIMDHIASVIIKIEELRNTAKRQYDVVLTFSQLVTTRILSVEEKNTLLRETRAMMMDRVFYKNGDSFLELLEYEDFDLAGYVTSTLENMHEQFNEVLIYVDTNRDQRLFFLIGAVLITLFVFYFYYLYLQKRLFVLRESVNQKEYFFIARPISTTIILIALWAVFSFTDRPKSFGMVLFAFITIPVIRIMMTLLKERMIRYYFAFVAIDLLFYFEQQGVDFELVDRTFNLIGVASLIALLIALKRSKLIDKASLGYIQTLLYGILPFTVLILIVALFANLYGAVMLSDRISHGVSYLILLIFVFYVLSTIITGYVVLLLRRRVSTASHLMERYAKKMERNIVFLVKLGMTIWWFWGVVLVLNQRDNVKALYANTMAYVIEIGTVTMTIQSIVDFIIILLGTWFTVKVVNIILTVEVFARIQFPRGIPTAISTTSNYVIVIAGVLMAFTSLGVTADQFAIIFGALGVGIGFGLRNIIANFVSGIIMVFERPVQIGDTIELDAIMGNVQKIGTRSTSIKTFDGSEVIIPNADFIAQKVTNWTLSDDRRRKVLLFKTDFDADIDQVLLIMKNVAMAHANVLKDPEPLATFQGFGEYYLEFKLYFWLSENLIVAQSDIAIAVYRELKAAGVNMPLPKQEFISKQDELA